MNEEHAESQETVLQSFNDNRKELLEFYRWVVSLSMFVLTASLASVATLQGARAYGWAFGLGWFLHLICLFANVLIVKRFTMMPLVALNPQESWGPREKDIMTNVKPILTLSFVQSQAFLWGTVLILLGFLLTFFFPVPASK